MRFLTYFLTILVVTFSSSADDTTTNNWLNRQALDSFLEDATAKGFAGVVGLSDADGTLYVRGFGTAAEATPYNERTIADIASITKQFTGAAILRLQEQGKLKLRDRLGVFFPKAPDDKAAITLHQLLTHTAGFPDVIGRDDEAIDRAAYIARAFAGPLDFTPGTKYEYSNVGYSILAAVIEIASGQDYEIYLFENLWKPAGMFNTGYYRPDWCDHTLPRLKAPVHGMFTAKEVLDRTRGDSWHLYGNGGVLSTAGDMLRWHRALLGNKILSAASRKLLFTPHVPEDKEGVYHYGYGWSVVPNYKGKKLVWHNGGSYFSRAEFWRFTDDGTAFFIASHNRAIEPYIIADGLAQILLGQTPAAINP
ncbi:serine hydrolase domain-containing protein [Kordiimonas sp.]|uniref:serine hydrolase domain-containing protein n=1 Tax=Kordiimonas sp. TaxID=1970157 RepID=UPI003A903F75